MNSNGDRISGRQGGKSAIGNLIVLGLLGYGIFVGIQYIPQRIEAAEVSGILKGVEQQHHLTPITNDAELKRVIGNQLSINDMRDMRDHIKTSWNQNRATVTVSYERDLNLLFTTKTIQYRDEVVLD